MIYLLDENFKLSILRMTYKDIKAKNSKILIAYYQTTKYLLKNKMQYLSIENCTTSIKDIHCLL